MHRFFFFFFQCPRVRNVGTTRSTGSRYRFTGLEMMSTFGRMVGDESLFIDILIFIVIDGYVNFRNFSHSDVRVSCR